MNIRIERIDIEDSLQMNRYVKWENDLQFNHFIVPRSSKDSQFEPVTIESTLEFFQKSPERLKNTFIVFDDKNPIGIISIHIDPDYLYKKESGTCWLGITIGEKEYWGTGAAKLAMELLLV